MLTSLIHSSGFVSFFGQCGQHGEAGAAHLDVDPRLRQRGDAVERRRDADRHRRRPFVQPGARLGRPASPAARRPAATQDRPLIVLAFSSNHTMETTYSSFVTAGTADGAVILLSFFS